MIFAENTPNSTGVAVYGDYKDFENLYEALHTVVGDEEDFVKFEAARIRVLGVCYDIRHALMGDREIEFVDNGMDEDMKRRMSVLVWDKNVYFKIYVLWPEMLFIMMALNDFVRLHARKMAGKSYDVMMDKQNIWDENIAMVRIFQSAVRKCIKDTVSEASFSRMMNLMNQDTALFENYTRQYLDVLNCRYIDMSSEKRVKSISAMAKRLAEKGKEYLQLKSEVAAAAKHYNTWEDNISAPVDYPDDFEW